jgi:hypothetical protein
VVRPEVLSTELLLVGKDEEYVDEGTEEGTDVGDEGADVGVGVNVVDGVVVGAAGAAVLAGTQTEPPHASPTPQHAWKHLVYSGTTFERLTCDAVKDTLWLICLAENRTEAHAVALKTGCASRTAPRSIGTRCIVCAVAH